MSDMFKVTCPFIHSFDVVVPNFSSINTITCEIDYEDYILKANPLILETYNGEFEITSLLTIKMDVTELLNCPIEIDTDNEIIIDEEKISIMENWNIDINTNDKIVATSTLKDCSSVDITNDVTLEMSPVVGVLVKLGELDPLTLGELDSKELNDLYYKIK